MCAALCEVITSLAHDAHDLNKNFGKVSTTTNDWTDQWLTFAQLLLPRSYT